MTWEVGRIPVQYEVHVTCDAVNKFGRLACQEPAHGWAGGDTRAQALAAIRALGWRLDSAGNAYCPNHPDGFIGWPCDECAFIGADAGGLRVHKRAKHRHAARGLIAAV